MDWSRSNGEVIFAHAQQQTSFSEKVLTYKNVFSLNKNESIVTSNLQKGLNHFFSGSFAIKESLMKPFTVILAGFDGLQCSSVPDFSVVKEMRARSVRLINLIASEVQN